MKKEAGWITTILMALAAVLGYSALPARKSADTEESGRTQSQNVSRPTPRAAALAASSALRLSPCWQIENSILIFISPGNYAVPDSCLQPADRGHFKPDNPTGSAQVRFVIATLPDPVHTHFSLLFDRLTEALQQAAQDQGYNYDSSWLPWVPEGKNSGGQKEFHDEDTRTAAQQSQPGVLVFRKALPAKSEYCGPSPPPADGPEARGHSSGVQSAKNVICHPPVPYDAGLILFVVGENPTGGIDAEQLQNAFDWIEALGGEEAKKKAGIVGPYFSGSLPSLFEGLLANHIVGPASPQAQVSKKNSHPPGPMRRARRDDKLTPQQPSARAQVQLSEDGQQPKALGKQDQLAERTGASKTFGIFSGSVTSKDGIDWFNAQLQGSPARFFSFQQNDDNMIDSYCVFLGNQGYDTGQLAIISEDETAYGSSPASPTISPTTSSNNSTASDSTERPSIQNWLPDCDTPNTAPRGIGRVLNTVFHGEANSTVGHGPLYVYYPRDIAALRSAYGQQQGSGTAKGQGSSTTGLPLDLIEPATREHDTISTFGERQTTLSQEATLFGIANLFKAHHIQFILLRSSNTLDQVFLTRFFSQTYPQARVVLTGADLLFRRSSDAAGFRGTLTLTTYPLLTWQQDWTHWQTPESRHSHRAFPQDTAEGLYLAARFLIDGQASEGDPPGSIPDASDRRHALRLNSSSIKIQDYAPPSWLITGHSPSDNCASSNPDGQAAAKRREGKVASPTRPPIWLSVVGNGQLWPVAVLGHCITDAKGPVVPEDTLPWADTKSKIEPSPSFELPLSMFVCCAVVLVWSFWHFFCCLFGSHTSSIRLGNRKLSPSSFRSLSYFAPVPRRQHKWLIFIGCLLTWLLAVELAAAMGILHFSSYALRNPGWAIWYCLLLGALSWGALLANYRTYLLPDWGKGDTSVAALQNAANPAFDTALMRKGAILFAMASLAVFWVFYGWIIPSLGPGVGAFAVWRSINLFTGVSATAPMLLLTAGLYGWFWYSLSGLALFNAGVPKLPHHSELFLTMPMYSREGPGKRIQDAAIPLKMTYGRHFLLFSLAYMAFWLLAGDVTSIRALGPTVFGRIYTVWFGLLIVLILTESWQMLRTWGQLRELLTYLDRMPLRRTLQALRGISWGTVWKMSGNVLEQRDRMISRQIESLRHLENELASLRTESPGTATILLDPDVSTGIDNQLVPLLDEQLAKCSTARDAFLQWFARNYTDSQYGPLRNRTVQSDLSEVAAFQKELATTAGVVLNRILIPAWRHETASQILETPSYDDKDKKSAFTLPKQGYVRAAEEFFCLPYLGFIQNVLGRIRTMTLAIICLFLGATLSVASYPFDPRPVTSGIFVVTFFVVAVVMTFVYAEMHRDPTLSHITNTNPGELGSDFWIKLITFGIGPFLGLITALFPDLAGFVTSWVQPTVGSIK